MRRIALPLAAFMAELARLRGGSESNLEPAFKALQELLPNVGAISANLGAHATLFQQEQIDIAPYNFNFVQTLKGKDVPVELAIPSGSVLLAQVTGGRGMPSAVSGTDGSF